MSASTYPRSTQWRWERSRNSCFAAIPWNWGIGNRTTNGKLKRISRWADSQSAMGETTVSVDKLKTRITRFRLEYLDTAQGRAHVKTAGDEAKEVQVVYKELLTKRHAGENITEETLKRLLPYGNTQGNRERGVRISTWPCITKDVKAWFEGANWKKPEEWPATAEWLLDICEAGRVANWTEWQELATHPFQKGFACGFITPIVHCLNDNLPVINSKVVKTYKALAEELGLKTKISSALEEYPVSQDLLIKLIAMLKEVGIQDLLQVRHLLSLERRQETRRRYRDTSTAPATRTTGSATMHFSNHQRTEGSPV